MTIRRALIRPGAPIVLTGSSGWLSEAFVARLGHWSDPDRPPDLRIFGSRARELLTPGGARIDVRPISTLSGPDVEGAHVFHFAFLGKERLADTPVDEYFSANDSIDGHVLRAVRDRAPASIVVSSSGAAADALTAGRRNLYGLCKLRQEDAFCALAGTLPVLVGRIFNLGGPHVNKVEGYALSSFVNQLIVGDEIAIRANRPVFRSYLHVYDLVDLAVSWSLCEGRIDGGLVDLCGPEVLEMGDMARRVSMVMRADPVKIRRPEIEDFSPDAYLGDCTQTLALAMRLGLELRPFDRQVHDTVEQLLTRASTPAIRSGS